MRKLVVGLLLLVLCPMVQAKEMRIPKLFADVDNQCVGLTYQKSSSLDILGCIADATTNPVNYTSGWSKYVNADIKLRIVGDSLAKTQMPYMTAEEEKAFTSIFIEMMKRTWYAGITEVRKQPGAYEVLTPEKLKALRY